MADSAFEKARLTALQACAVMDTPREPMFDNLVFTAAQLLRAPVAALLMVGEDRVWPKASVGPLERSWDRATLFAETVVHGGEPLMLENAEVDPRFAGLLKATEPGVRFCAAVPVFGPDRYRMGVLCTLDSSVRVAPKRQMMHLQQLADQAGELLELRVPGLDLTLAERRFRIS